MNNKVTYAKLHSGIFIPGLGNLADTLPPSSKTITNLSLTYLENGSILMQWGKGNRAVIGAANVAVAVLGPEESNG